ncbi:Thyroid adenoma-associated protein [Strongyloides ratti]|uniref:Thyroid adenoma-associated protein n=1 Tax=Strongyloides ratti TaxID=34506 RepID=A0A090L5K3_STRRB|nr:Thyroid adenoma-associated protein [Strongyloides ratti]CEF65076.1 Thyroid adenoma-associated protein [Strongyloides ratti]
MVTTKPPASKKNKKKVKGMDTALTDGVQQNLSKKHSQMYLENALLSDPNIPLTRKKMTLFQDCLEQRNRLTPRERYMTAALDAIDDTDDEVTLIALRDLVDHWRAYNTSQTSPNEQFHLHILTYMPFYFFRIAPDAIIKSYITVFEACLKNYLMKYPNIEFREGEKPTNQMIINIEKGIRESLYKRHTKKVVYRCYLSFMRILNFSSLDSSDIDAMYNLIIFHDLTNIVTHILMIDLEKKRNEARHIHCLTYYLTTSSQDIRFLIYDKILPEMVSSSVLQEWFIKNFNTITGGHHTHKTVVQSTSSTMEIDPEHYASESRIVLAQILSGMVPHEKTILREKIHWKKLIGLKDMIKIVFGSHTRVAITAMSLILLNKTSNLITKEEFDIIIGGFYIHAPNCTNNTIDPFMNVMSKVMRILCDGGEVILKDIFREMPIENFLIHTKICFNEMINKMFAWCFLKEAPMLNRIGASMLELIYIKNGFKGGKGSSKVKYHNYINCDSFITMELMNKSLEGLKHAESYVKDVISCIIKNNTHVTIIKQKLEEYIQLTIASRNVSQVGYIQTLLEIFSKSDDFNLGIMINKIEELLPFQTYSEQYIQFSGDKTHIYVALSLFSTVFSLPKFEEEFTKKAKDLTWFAKFKHHFLTYFFIFQGERDNVIQSEYPEGYISEHDRKSIEKFNSDNPSCPINEATFARDNLALSMRITKCISSILVSLIKMSSFEQLFDYNFRKLMVGYYFHQLINTRHVGSYRVVSQHFQEVCKKYSEVKFINDSKNCTSNGPLDVITYGNEDGLLDSLNLEGYSYQWIENIYEYYEKEKYKDRKLKPKQKYEFRRSAGIPYLISTMLMYEKFDENKEYQYMNKIMKSIQDRTEELSENDLTEIYILKSLLTNKSLSKRTEQYLSHWLIFCFQNCYRTNFSIKNSIFQLYVVVLTRIFGNPKIQRDSFFVEDRLKVKCGIFFKKYPELYELIHQLLFHDKKPNEQRLLFTSMLLSYIKPDNRGDPPTIYETSHLIPNLLRCLLQCRDLLTKNTIIASICSISTVADFEAISKWLYSLLIKELAVSSIISILCFLHDYLTSNAPIVQTYFDLCYHIITQIQGNLATRQFPDYAMIVFFRLIKVLERLLPNGGHDKIDIRSEQLEIIYKNSGQALRDTIARFIATHQDLDYVLCEIPKCLPNYLRYIAYDKECHSFTPEGMARLLTANFDCPEIKKIILHLFNTRKFPDSCVEPIVRWIKKIKDEKDDLLDDQEFYLLLISLESKIRNAKHWTYQLLEKDIEMIRMEMRKPKLRSRIVAIDVIQSLLQEAINNGASTHTLVQALFPLLKDEDKAIARTASRILARTFKLSSIEPNAELMLTLILYARPKYIIEYNEFINYTDDEDEEEQLYNRYNQDLVIFMPAVEKNKRFRLDELVIPPYALSEIYSFLSEHATYGRIGIHQEIIRMTKQFREKQISLEDYIEDFSRTVCW